MSLEFELPIPLPSRYPQGAEHATPPPAGLQLITSEKHKCRADVIKCGGQILDHLARNCMPVPVLPVVWERTVRTENPLKAKRP